MSGLPGRPARLRLATVGISVLLIAPGPASAESTGAVIGRVVVRSLTVVLALSAETVMVGDRFQAKVTVFNPGPEAVRQVTAELRLDTVGLTVSGPQTKTITRVGAGKDASVTWNLRGIEPGTYLVLAQASGDWGTVESAARLVTVLDVARVTSRSE
jgi:hypothetical protein